jgi:hypothetical protein
MRRIELQRVFDFGGTDVLRGRDLRGVAANSRSSRSDMESTISLEAPFSFDLGVSPRLAERAAPAAICCFLDRAGMMFLPQGLFLRTASLERCSRTRRPGVTVCVAKMQRVASSAAKGTCTQL